MPPTTNTFFHRAQSVNVFIKVFDIAWVVLFIIFAGLQYNDPDPYVWMPIYLYGASLCYFAAKRLYNFKTYFWGIVVYGIYAVYKIFDATGVIHWIKEHHAESIVQSMKATKPWIEETREFGGLMILIIVLAINWIYFKRKISS